MAALLEHGADRAEGPQPSADSSNAHDRRAGSASQRTSASPSRSSSASSTSPGPSARARSRIEPSAVASLASGANASQSTLPRARSSATLAVDAQAQCLVEATLDIPRLTAFDSVSVPHTRLPTARTSPDAQGHTAPPHAATRPARRGQPRASSPSPPCRHRRKTGRTCEAGTAANPLDPARDRKLCFPHAPRAHRVLRSLRLRGVRPRLRRARGRRASLVALVVYRGGPSRRVTRLPAGRPT